MNYLSKRFKEAMVDRAKARDTKRREQEVKRQPPPNVATLNRRK